MREQAPRSNLGGNIVRESWRGLMRAEIEALADQEHPKPVLIGQVDSDSPSAETNREELTASINALLTLFDIDPDSWQTSSLKLYRSNRFPEREESKEYIQRNAIGLSAGKSLFEWQFGNLRIEDEEDGWGLTGLAIALNDTLKVVLTGQGDHWSGHHYRDPESGDMLTEHWDDARILELQESLELVEYEVGFSITFNAYFVRPNAPDPF